MTTATHCRLEAGPFDGDHGAVLAPPPDVIWAFACPGQHAAGACNQSGVHWCFDEVRRDRLVEIFGAEMERYAYDRVEAGTFVYVWSGLVASGSRGAREEALA